MADNFRGDFSTFPVQLTVLAIKRPEFHSEYKNHIQRDDLKLL